MTQFHCFYFTFILLVICPSNLHSNVCADVFLFILSITYIYKTERETHHCFSQTYLQRVDILLFQVVEEVKCLSNAVNLAGFIRVALAAVKSNFIFST